jgi:hypothetical protein
MEPCKPDYKPNFENIYSLQSLPMVNNVIVPLMNRFDRFLEVVLDFTGVDFIGQGFADEIFRVFARAHPSTRLIPVHYTDTVEKMITHVRANKEY